MKRFGAALLLPLVLACVFAATGAVVADPGYFRYPDIHGDRIAFAAEGDLWVAPERGGAARRLTTHAGTEYFPQFSPDGKSIAFTGEYDGNRDVFVIPAEGGEPVRLTWHPGGDEVVGWTPDGKRVIFRSSRGGPHGDVELFTIPAAGGDPEKLPLGWAVRVDIDPGTGAWAFNRKFWERRTWKRYRGGTAPDIWFGHPDRADFRQVTDFPGVDDFPMWSGGRIYFLSDQGGAVNIWSIKPDGGDRKRHTNFKDWDARWPSMGPDGRIVFTLGADIHVFDIRSGAERKVDVELPSDRVLTRVRYPEPGRALTWFEISPDGDRVVVVARGEIFSAPVKEGVTLPVTHGSGARESWASFSPDGKRLVYVTDEPLEEEIRTTDAWGRGETKVVKAAGASGWHFPPIYSPDGQWIAYGDETQALWIVPAEGGQPRQVDRSGDAEIRDYSWSPDGRFLAYSKLAPSQFSAIFIYDTRSSKVHQVTGPYTDDRLPAWDPDGRYLYFLSDRFTNPLLGVRDWDNIDARGVKPYMLLLRKDVKNPFAPLAGLPSTEDDKKNDDEKAKSDAKDEKKTGADKKDGEKKTDADKEKKDEKPKPVEIDFDGLAGRILELPVPPGSYSNLGCTAKQVFYFSSPLKGMAEMPQIFDESPPDSALIAFDLEEKKPKTFMDGVSGYAIARKADKIAVMKQRGEIFVVGAGGPPGGEKLAESKVSLANVSIELSPLEEWRQIYYEAWRLMRDFYWDASLGGLDWKAMRGQYATLLPRLSTRDDLRDLLGELIGELSTSHTYVFGGDPGVRARPVPTGLLGAEVRREGDFYKVVRIYRGDAADRVRSPLDEPGVNVAEGDFILSVNHAPFAAGGSFYSFFENLAGKPIVLTVNSKPSREGARDVVLTPLGQEGELRYADWVRRNREYVAEKTGGKIGYIHIPDMWKDGLIQFNTWFYPQLDREGLVVDARWNGGGSVSQMIVERLRRRLISFDRARGGGVTTYPARVLNGPFVVLTNEFAGSDGDIFPQAVQIEKLAPVIGMRSWGGVVGIRGDKPLVDGGMLTQPEFAWWDFKDGWALENRGVIPDIEVQNLPQELARGVDAQLDRAVAEVLKLHKERPPLKPGFTPARDRSRAAYESEVQK